MKLSRRDFIIRSGLATCSLGLAPRRLWAKEDEYWLHEAMHYGVQDGGVVNCMLCPRGCVITDGLRSYSNASISNVSDRYCTIQ